MHTINLKEFGHLVNGDNFNTALTRPDFYTLISNPMDWEKRYIHPDYEKQFQPNFTHAQVK